MADNGICFVIAPIGEEGSETRQRSDKILKFIIKPAVEECGYTAERADHIPEPGNIQTQVVRMLIDSPLVIADLTGYNPNVFYELAVRHAVRKPVIQIIQSNEKLPFDVFNIRTIPVDSDVEIAEKARESIIEQIQATQKPGYQVENLVSLAVDLKQMHGSQNPIESTLANLVEQVASLREEVGNLRQSRDQQRPLGSIPNEDDFSMDWVAHGKEHAEDANRDLRLGAIRAEYFIRGGSESPQETKMKALADLEGAIRFAQEPALAGSIPSAIYERARRAHRLLRKLVDKAK